MVRRQTGTQADQPRTSGPAPDGKGTFSYSIAEPLGLVPTLGFGRPDTFGQREQAVGTASGMLEKAKDLKDQMEQAFKNE